MVLPRAVIALMWTQTTVVETETEENHAGGHHAQADRLLRLLPLPPAVEVEVEVEEILFVKPLVNLAVELVLAREGLQTEAAFCKGMLTRLQLQSFPTRIMIRGILRDDSLHV